LNYWQKHNQDKQECSADINFYEKYWVNVLVKKPIEICCNTKETNEIDRIVFNLIFMLFLHLRIAANLVL